MKISKMYGMIAPNVNNTETIRNVYIIDPEQKIRAILQYPLTNGRNIGEILRLVLALQTTDKDGVATPANWLPGQPVIVPSPKTFDELLERVQNPMGYNCMDWYLCFKGEYQNIMANNISNITNDFNNMFTYNSQRYFNN